MAIGRLMDALDRNMVAPFLTSIETNGISVVQERLPFHHDIGT